MISFIIPAYNASKTIEKTINSIINQEESVLEYEVVVVNDGSTDNLDDVMKQYKDFERIKYFKKENSGVSDTRNLGVEKSCGDYIIFVDSDDYIGSTLLKDIEVYINKNIDLIKWNPIIVDEQNRILQKPNINSFDIVTGEQGFNLLFGKDNLIDCLWNYAIKKEIMLKFPSGCYHEDFAVMPRIILTAKSFVSIKNYEYFYVQTAGSIMRDNNNEKERKKLQDKLEHFDNLIEETNKMEINSTTKQNAEIYYTNSMLTVIGRLHKQNRKYYIKELKKRKVYKYIKVRNLKQLIKRVILMIKFAIT